MTDSEGPLHDVRSYGTTGDGESLDTDPIQTALDACGDTRSRVHLPPGDYLSGPLCVHDDTTSPSRRGQPSSS